MKERDLLVVLFLRCGEGDGSRADPQLQHDVVLWAEHREDAAFFSTETLQLHQQAELFCKSAHNHRADIKNKPP